MLWYAYLLGVALWAYPQAPKVPSRSMVQVDKLMVTTHIAELLAPPPPVTVTVTVRVVATPVVHTAAVPPRYPTATPRARPSYYEYDEYSDSDILNTPLSFHDAILAFSDWFENDGFNVDFRVTPLRLTIAAFVFGCLQLAFMIFFRDYHLLRKVAMSFFRGVCAGSQVFWTLLLGGIMCLTYDRLTESPAAVVFSELLLLNEVYPCFISSFVREIVLARQSHGRSLGRFRFIRPIFNFCLDILSWIWGMLSPFITAGIVALASLAWAVIWACLRFAYAQVTEHGYSWESPFRLIYDILTGLYRFLLGCYIYASLWIWVNILNPCPCKGKTPFEVSSDLASTYKQHEALQALARLSIWEMADIIMERDNLKFDLEHLESVIRARIMKDIAGMTKALGERAISWRTSHMEMCIDYNHCRRTLDLFAATILCNLMNIDPNGSLASRFFVSACLITTEEPLPNGLHYKPSPMFAEGTFVRTLRNKCGVEMSMILKNLRAGITCGSRFTPVPTMDLYNQDTWAFDLRQMGFNFAAFSPENNPIDLTKRKAKHYQLKEMEDYAAEGRILEWYDDLPARPEKKAQKQHAFYNTYGG